MPVRSGPSWGSRLLEAGHDVHFIARGANLDAQRERGLLIRSDVFGEKRYHVHATASAAEVGPSDFVVLAVKASALTDIAPLVEDLKGADTTFVSTQNGLPWVVLLRRARGRQANRVCRSRRRDRKAYPSAARFGKRSSTCRALWPVPASLPTHPVRGCRWGEPSGGAY